MGIVLFSSIKMEKFYSGGYLYNPKTKSVLLHLRDGETQINPHKWAFFGGMHRDGETPIETFIREMNEELGIDILPDQVKLLRDYINDEFGIRRYVFFVESDLPKEQMHLGEGADFDWIPLEKVFDYGITAWRQTFNATDMSTIYPYANHNTIPAAHVRRARGDEPRPCAGRNTLGNSPASGARAEYGVP